MKGGIIGRWIPRHQAGNHVLLVLCLLLSRWWPVEEISDGLGLELAPIACDLLIIPPLILFLFPSLVLYLILIDDVLHLLYHFSLLSTFVLCISGELLGRNFLKIAFVNTISLRSLSLLSGLI